MLVSFVETLPSRAEILLVLVLMLVSFVETLPSRAVTSAAPAFVSRAVFKSAIAVLLVSICATPV